ncbi:hypothetical protein PC110_g13706 [Phytophthora cactorum]|uniref:Uncharacterized protein n=1 Tax=Phytophthora cactorum TaxID=29920 RepID=A0A329S2P1_9STRA|nr:hypothetical protein PC113_g15065 [Phytophthora cactorum]KAG2902860.1 hypothetical protein PC117_g21387 [Phytophthora cactorum]KAG4049788.1 hypothetical protein PC123_g14938 [Phytophthora cactorum]RAW29922.1 hypothetical protein PC110_g13706 [Phytophthora cactorum]
MNLLTTIQNNLLKQLEEEARNYFSRVSDFRCFISDARPGPDVIATLKLRCLSAERLSSGHGTCFIGVDAIQRTASSYAAIEKNMYAQIIVEYVGIYDDVAKGCVVYDPTRDSQIEPISPPLRRPPLHRETLKKPTKGKPPAVRISKPVGHEAGSGGAFRMVMEDNEE